MEIDKNIMEKKLWESWLDEVHRLKLKSIRNAVQELYDLNTQKYYELPFYTPHGPHHCQAVENLIYKLIPGDLYKELSIKGTVLFAGFSMAT